MKPIKSTFRLLVLLLALVLPLSSAGARAVFPEVIPLQDGFQPEGIAAGKGNTFYTGSLNGGAIFRGDVRTGQVEMIAGPEARMAVGMSYDKHSGLLFVAGGAFGDAHVFDGDTGDLLASYQLTTSTPTFINDVIVTKRAAYFTDSFQKQFYGLPLGPHGALPDAAQIQTIPLGDGFGFTPGEFNANGIEVSANGKTLIINNTFEGTLYRVDPHTGEAVAIDLDGGSLPAGDGLVRRGNTLFVVQNFLNQIAVVELDPGYHSGEITGLLTSPHFRVPTTAARFGDALYAVNARFDEVPPGNPAENDQFEAVRVQIH